MDGRTGDTALEADADALYRAILKVSESAGGRLRMSWLDIVHAGAPHGLRFGAGDDLDADRVLAAVERLKETDRITENGPGRKYILTKGNHVWGKSTRRSLVETAKAARVAGVPRSSAAKTPAPELDVDHGAELDLPDLSELGDSPLADIVREEIRNAKLASKEASSLERQLLTERAKALAHADVARKIFRLIEKAEQ